MLLHTWTLNPSATHVSIYTLELWNTAKSYTLKSQNNAPWQHCTQLVLQQGKAKIISDIVKLPFEFSFLTVLYEEIMVDNKFWMHAVNQSFEFVLNSFQIIF